MLTAKTRRSLPAFRAVTALALREMETTYGRSPGGYLWAFLEPVAGIALLSLVFSLILRSPSLGTNFPLFYATGMTVYMGYLKVSMAVAGSLTFSRALLQYPAVTYMDSVLARFCLNFLTQIVVAGVILIGIVEIYDLNLVLRWPPILQAFAMSGAIAFGVGVLNCYLFSRFQVWQRIWAVVTRPLLILSAVLFIPEDVPARYQDLFMLNPLAHMTSEMRRGFYGTYDAVLVNPAYVYAWALGLSVAGVFLLYHFHQDALNR